jgi:hypothetical protein
MAEGLALFPAAGLKQAAQSNRKLTARRMENWKQMQLK